MGHFENPKFCERHACVRYNRQLSASRPVDPVHMRLHIKVSTYQSICVQKSLGSMRQWQVIGENKRKNTDCICGPGLSSTKKTQHH